MESAEQSSKKKVSELLVRDLKSELEKRGLDKNGVKTALVERLSKALQDEGKNPDEYLFDVSQGDKITPSKGPIKRSNRKAKESDSEMADDDDDEKQEEEEPKAEVKEDSKDVEKADGEKTSSSPDETKKTSNNSEAENNAQCNGSATEDGSKTDLMANSPPGPENAPVLAPLTVEDVIKLDTSSKAKPSDNDSMFVNPDDTQSDMDSSVYEKESCDENATEEVGENADENKENCVKEGTENIEESSNLTDNAKVDTDTKNSISESTNAKEDSALENAKTKESSASENDKSKESAASENDKSKENAASENDKPKESATSGKDKTKESAASGKDKPKESATSAKDKTKENSTSENDKTKESATSENDKTKESSTSENDKTTGNSTSETPSATPKSKSDNEKEGASEKDVSVKKVAASSKNLWVSGLAEKTRAHDLKTLFSKYGKVSGAKIVTNARMPGACCYGFITMSSSEEATVCIEKLNKTEFHGRVITVEKTTREPTGSIKRADLKALKAKSGTKRVDKRVNSSASNEGKSEVSEKSKSDANKVEKDKGKSDKKSTDKKSDKPKSSEKKSSDGTDEKNKDGTESAKENDTESKKESKRRSSRDRSSHSRDRERRRLRRSRSRSRERFGFRGSFYRRGFNRGFGFRPYFNRNMGDSHYRMRDRDHDMDRRFSELRQKEIERKNREESIRLERERERLRIERERLERERAEVLRMEREKQRLERERLEREKAELRKRSQMTLEDRRGTKRGFDALRDSDFLREEIKRHVGMRRESSLDLPPKGFDFGRSRGSFPDRRSDRFEGRPKGGDISPTFGGRREGRRELEFPPRNNRDGERGREEWKGKPGRDRGFDRPGFHDRGRNFERPPWEGGQANRNEDGPPLGNAQWPPVIKNENWGHMEQNPPERWGPMEHTRGQPNMNMGPPGIGHSQNSPAFGNAPGGDLMAPMPGHFNVDRFNSNMMRRF